MMDGKERPIPFSGAMVRAILEGRKAQTRRVMKVQPPGDGYIASRLTDSTFAGDRKNIGRLHWIKMHDSELRIVDAGETYFDCPYGQIGDRLWVRETWGNVAHQIDDNGDLRKWNPDRPATKVNEIKFGSGYYSGHIIYRADGEFEWCNDYGEQNSCWHRSIHMPRAASRITLEVTNIRIERLKDISEEDAKAEGCDYSQTNAAISVGWFEKPVSAFRRLWESINGVESWDLNPWVWVIEFKRV